MEEELEEDEDILLAAESYDEYVFDRPNGGQTAERLKRCRIGDFREAKLVVACTACSREVAFCLSDLTRHYGPHRTVREVIGKMRCRGMDCRRLPDMVRMSIAGRLMPLVLPEWTNLPDVVPPPRRTPSRPACL